MDPYMRLDVDPPGLISDLSHSPEVRMNRDKTMTSHQQERLKEEKEQQQEMLKKVKANLEKPCGVLAVHIKEASFMTLNPDHASESEEASVYMRVSAGKQVKMTCVYDKVEPPTKVIFDDIKHFLLQISPNRNDTTNVVRIEVITFEESNPSRHRLLSAKQVHLYELVKKLYAADTYEMWNPRIQKLIAEVDIEFCFSYGSFGYGYSNQFENRQKTPKEQLTHSLFCRVEPPLHRKEGGSEVLTSVPVGHPAFINFTRRVELGTLSQDLGPAELSAHEWRVVEKPKLFIARSRRRMHTMQKDFAKLSNRRERIKYLQKLIMNNDGSKVGLNVEYFNAPAGLKLKRRTHRSRDQQQMMPVPGSGLEEEEEEELVGGKKTDQADIEGALAVLKFAPGIRTRVEERQRRSVTADELDSMVRRQRAMAELEEEEAEPGSSASTESGQVMTEQDTLPKWRRKLAAVTNFTARLFQRMRQTVEEKEESDRDSREGGDQTEAEEQSQGPSFFQRVTQRLTGLFSGDPSE